MQPLQKAAILGSFVAVLVSLFAPCNSSKPRFAVSDNFSVWLPEHPQRPQGSYPSEIVSH